MTITQKAAVTEENAKAVVHRKLTDFSIKITSCRENKDITESAQMKILVGILARYCKGKPLNPRW